MKITLIKIISILILLMSGCNSNEVPAKAIEIKAKNPKSINDDFSKKDPAWSSKVGTWIFKQGVLKQSSTNNMFPLILLEKEKFSNVDVSVDFKPVSGRIDASGGIIFRAADKDNYYIVRANSLENNFRLYTFKDGRRSQIASATVDEPEIRKFHNMRVVAKGNHIQAYLNGKLLIDHHDDSFDGGYIGLWTKADAVTDFDNLKVVGK